METCNDAAQNSGVMKMAIRGILAATAIACAACGGGGTSPASPATQQTPAAPVAPPAPSAKPIVIALRGDSTDYGTCPGDPGCPADRLSPTPAQMLQADLNARFGAGKVLVEDESVPGTKLQDDLSPTALAANLLAAHLKTSDADIVATNSEINDYFSGESSGDYAVLLQQWVQTVRAANKTPLLIEPNPVCRTVPSAYTQQHFVAQMRAQGAALGVSVIPMFDAFSQLTPQPLASDCIHPTPSGYAFKERQLIVGIAPVVQAMLDSRN